MPEPVRLEGLKETRARLKELGDADKSKQFKQIGYDIGEQVIIPTAKGYASTRMERRAANTLKPMMTSTGGAVSYGGGFPGSMGAEFGAFRNQRRQGRPGGVAAVVQGWQQFKPWRGNDTGAGYFVWPAIRDKTEDIIYRFAYGLEEMWEEGDV
jgi:hypothetical protein